MIVNKTNYDIELFHQSRFLNFETRDLGYIRKTHLLESLKRVDLQGEILEFGVYKAVTTNIIAEFFPNKIVHGFDSFEGLPEQWNISYKEKYNKHKKGYFALEQLPQVRDNVKLWKGWFDDTITDFLQKKDITQISFLHVDSDLYSSAKTIFDNLNKFIVPNTVVVFDEFYPWGRKRYETWKEHEYKALHEWTKDYDREFEILAHNNHQQCAIKIRK